MMKKTRIFVFLVMEFIFFFLIISLPLSVYPTSSSPSLSQSNLQGTNNPNSRSLKQEDIHVHEVHCSRERSRAAWKIIQDYLMPFLEKEKYQISPQCRLHSSNDLFRDQEEHKIHMDVNDWQCRYCKKTFRAEKYLDQHFDNRHSNLLDVNNGKCLAEVCGALHCDVVMDSAPHKSKKCNPAAASKNRHLCESLADSCFPVNQGPSAARLHDFFLRQFCDSHTCSGGKKTIF